MAIDATTGQDLGVQWVAEDGTLQIDAVMPGGLVAQWNAANPTLVVKRGDHIVEVNGIRRDVRQLSKECNKNKILRLVIKRSEYVNDEGAPVFLGKLTQKYYCGRELGRDALPGSFDGICGPYIGPQCASCKRYQIQKLPPGFEEHRKPPTRHISLSEEDLENIARRPNIEEAMLNFDKAGGDAEKYFAFFRLFEQLWVPYEDGAYRSFWHGVSCLCTYISYYMIGNLASDIQLAVCAGLPFLLLPAALWCYILHRYHSWPLVLIFILIFLGGPLLSWVPMLDDGGTAYVVYVTLGYSLHGAFALLGLTFWTDVCDKILEKLPFFGPLAESVHQENRGRCNPIRSSVTSAEAVQGGAAACLKKLADQVEARYQRSDRACSVWNGASHVFVAALWLVAVLWASQATSQSEASGFKDCRGQPFKPHALACASDTLIMTTSPADDDVYTALVFSDNVMAPAAFPNGTMFRLTPVDCENPTDEDFIMVCQGGRCQSLRLPARWRLRATENCLTCTCEPDKNTQEL